MQPFNYFNPANRGQVNYADQYKQAKADEEKRQMENSPEAKRIKAFQLMNLENAERQQAMVTDAKQAKTLIANGDIQGAMNFLQGRAQLISELGGSARETMEVYNALRAGQPDMAMGMINNFLTVAEGLNQKPSEPKVGRFRTERLNGEVVMYDSATGEEVKRWAIPESAEDREKLRKTIAQADKAETESQLAAITAESEEDKRMAAVNMAREASAIARGLADNPDLGQAVGTVSTWLPTFRESTQDVINEAQRLESLLTVDNLKLMSGVLTDRDIAFLTRVASGINITDSGIKGSEPAVKRRLLEIANKIDESISTNQPLDPKVKSTIGNNTQNYNPAIGGQQGQNVINWNDL